MPDPDTEKPGQLLEEIDPKNSATPEELGVSGSAAEHDLTVNFDDAIDQTFAGLPKKEDDEAEKSYGKEEKPESVEGEEKKETADETEKKEEAAKPADDTKEQKPKAEEKPESKPEDKAAEKPSDRDKDLNAISAKLDPHTKPKTRKIIDGIKSETVKARDRADLAEKSLTEAKSKIAELEKAASSKELPKELKEEIETLRDRVRELDITRDPQIIARYDKRIDDNTKVVLDALSRAGLPQERVDALKKSGVTLSSVKPYVDMIESGKGADGKQYTADPETAEAIREAIRDNGRLSKEKEKEIGDWKTNWDDRQKEATAKNDEVLKEANERRSKMVIEHRDKWDFLKEPPAPNDNDTPAIKREKEKARVAFNDIVAKYGESVKKETSSPIESAISATVGIIYRDIVAPELKKQLTASQAKVTELENQIKALKGAGSISKTVGATPGKTQRKPASSDADIDPDDPFGGIIDDLARSTSTHAEE